MGRWGGAEAAGESVVEGWSGRWEAVSEEEVFSMDHLKRSFSFGSMMAFCGGFDLGFGELKDSQRQLCAMSG